MTLLRTNDATTIWRPASNRKNEDLFVKSKSDDFLKTICNKHEENSYPNDDLEKKAERIHKYMIMLKDRLLHERQELELARLQNKSWHQQVPQSFLGYPLHPAYSFMPMNMFQSQYPFLSQYGSMIPGIHHVSSEIYNYSPFISFSQQGTPMNFNTFSHLDHIGKVCQDECNRMKLCTEKVQKLQQCCDLLNEITSASSDENSELKRSQIREVHSSKKQRNYRKSRHQRK